MAKGFNLTAEINLRGPSNIRQVVGGIRKQLQGINTSLNININKKNIQGINQANSRLAAINKTLQVTTKNARDATTAFNKLSASMKGVANVKIPNNISSGMNTATKSIQTSTKAVRQAKNEFEEFGKLGGLAIKRFAAFSVVTGAIYSVNNALSAGVKQFLEYDRQLTRVTQVLNTNRESLKGLDKTITSLSTSLGVSSAELANVTVTLSQAGIQANDTRKALEALAKSALAPTFDSLTNTTEGAIAAMRQFGITAGQLEGALGSINAVAGSFAVEASDIITAIQRTGGVFASASKGVSQGTAALNEFISVFTSVRATSRESAETIATGLRTIFTRLQRTDTIDALKEFGVTLTDLEGKFVGPFKAIQLLSEGLRSLDTRDLRFAGIAEELGGFRQIGKVLPLIQQFGTAQNALNVAQQGSSSLARDAAKGQLALAVQIQKVREEFTALVRSVSDSTGFRNLLSLGLDLSTVFIRVADSLKGLLPLIAGLGAVKGLSALAGFTKGFGGVFKKSDGGYIHKFARGGVVPGTGSRDTVPAMLQPGEFVIRKKAVESIGTKRLHKMNKFAKGGRVGRVKNLGAHDGDSWNIIYEPADDPVGSITTRAVGYDAYELSGGKQWENKLGAIATKMADTHYKKNTKLVGSGPFLQSFQADKVRGQHSVGSRPKHKVSKKLVDRMVEAGVANRVTQGNNATGTTDKPSVRQIATLKANGFNYNPETGRTTKISKKNTKALGGYIQAFASGGRVGDTVPAMLTPGEFVINKKSASQIGSRALHSLNRADKIKGFNRGGFVGFRNGGGVPARPGTTMGTIGITQADVSILDEIGNAIKELGISSSSSADLIAQGSQASYEAAIQALEADKMRADAIGANTDAIGASIKSLQNQGKKVLKVSQALAGAGGGDLEKLSGKLNRGQDAGKASKSLRTKEGGALNNLIRAGEADVESIKQYIAAARRDRKTLNEMDARYVNERKRQLSALGSSDEEASKLAEQEVRLRRKAVDDNAKAIGAKGPGDFGRRLGALANKSGFAIAALGSFAGAMNEATSASQAATSAAIAGGATAFGAGQVATGAIIDLLPTDELKNLGGIVGTVASTALGLGQALIDAKNAARQFRIDEAFKKSEQSIESVNASFDKLSQDVNNTSIVSDIESQLARAGAELSRGLQIQNESAKLFWSNAIDIALSGSSDPDAVLRAQVLETRGFFAYLQTSFDDVFKSQIRRDINAQQAQQQIKQFKVVADGINRFLEQQLKSGLDSEDIVANAGASGFYRSLALADSETQRLITSIRDNTTLTQEEKDARIQSIISINGEAIARQRIAVVQRTMEIEALQKSTNIYVRSLERMYQNMEQSINSVAFALSKMDNAIGLTIASLQGQAKIGDVVLDAINVLQNPRAYESGARNSAAASVSNIFGRSGSVMSSLLGLGETLEVDITSKLNSLIGENQTDAGVINRQLKQTVFDTLKGVTGLPPDLAEKLSREVSLFLDKEIKAGEEVDFGSLAEKLGSLNSVIDTSTNARQAAIKALEFYNNVLNTYTSNLNKVIDIEISSRNYARKSVEILADSQMELNRSLGKTISVLDVINNFQNRIGRLSGVGSDPTDIFNNINRLETERKQRQATVNATAQLAGTETDQFTKANNALKATDIQLRENITSLRELANNGDIAAAALNKIQEAQQRNAQQVGFFEKVLTSTPDELEELNRTFIRLNRNINNQTNTINNSVGAQKAYFEALRSGASGFQAMRAAQGAFAKERGQTLNLLKDILPFLGETAQAGGIRANVLESMFRESGIGMSPVLQQILNALRNPQVDPAAAAAIQQYNQANADRSEANRLLGLLESNLARETAIENETALKRALNEATLTFESEQLSDIARGVTTIVGLMENPPPPRQGFATGGVVYAAGGQQIFKPKGTDTVPAMLTPGEFVVNRQATKNNLPLLKNINAGYYAAGGIVSDWKDNTYVDTIPRMLKKFVSKEELPTQDTINKLATLAVNKPGQFGTAGTHYATMPGSNSQLPSRQFDPTFAPAGARTPNKDRHALKKAIDPGMQSYDGTSLSHNGINIIGSLPIIDTQFERAVAGVSPDRLSSINLTDSNDQDMKDDMYNYTRSIWRTSLNKNKIKSEEADAYNVEMIKLLTLLTNQGYDLNNPGIASDHFLDVTTLPKKQSANRFRVNPNNHTIPQHLGLIHTQGKAASTFVASAPIGLNAYAIHEGQRFNGFPALNVIANSRVGFDQGAYNGARWKSPTGNYLHVPQDKLVPDLDNLIKNHIEVHGLLAKMLQVGGLWDVNKGNWDPRTGLPKGLDTTGRPELNPLFHKLSRLYNGDTGYATITGNISQLDRAGEYIKTGSKIPLTIVGKGTVFERELRNKAGQIQKLRREGLPIPDGFKDAIFGTKNARGGIGDGVVGDLFDMDVPNAAGAYGGVDTYDWVANVDPRKLSQAFEEAMEEEERSGVDGPNSIKLLPAKRIKGKIPFGAVGNKPLDFLTQYQKYKGQFYEPASDTYKPGIIQGFLPYQKNAATIFENIDPNHIDQIAFRKELAADDFLKVKGFQGIHAEQYYDSLLADNPDAALERRISKATLTGKPTWFKSGLPLPVPRFIADGFAGPQNFKIGDKIVEELKAKAKEEQTGPAEIDPGKFARQKKQNLEDQFFPKITKELVTASQEIFGVRPFVRGLGQFIARRIGAFGVRNQNLDTKEEAMGAGGRASSTFNQVGAIAAQMFDRTFNENQAQYLKDRFILASGATQAFGGIASGNTQLLRDFSNVLPFPIGGADIDKARVEGLFRSLGGGVALDAALGYDLPNAYKQIFQNDLKNGRFATINGNRITYQAMDQIIGDKTNLGGLIDLIFNPYNEFPEQSIRSNLMTMFARDLANLKGGRGLPFFSEQQMEFINYGIGELKKYYGGEGLGPGAFRGLDYLYDEKNNPGLTMFQRAQDLITNFTANYDKYDTINAGFGLNNKFGALPQADWIKTRGRRGFIDPVNRARGGMIYASNGQMINFQPKGTDTVPAMLTPGEFVVNKKATQKHLPLIKAINSGSAPTQYLADGDIVVDPNKKYIRTLGPFATPEDRHEPYVRKSRRGGPLISDKTVVEGGTTSSQMSDGSTNLQLQKPPSTITAPPATRSTVTPTPSQQMQLQQLPGTVPQVQTPSTSRSNELPLKPRSSRSNRPGPPGSGLPIPGSGAGGPDLSDMLNPGGRGGRGGGDAARGTGTGNDDILGPGGLFPEEYRIKKPTSGLETTGTGWLSAFGNGVWQAIAPSLAAMGASTLAISIGTGLATAGMAATAPISLPLSALILGGGLATGAIASYFTKQGQDWAINEISPGFFQHLKQLEADHPIATALGAGLGSLGTGAGIQKFVTGMNPFSGELSRRLVSGGIESMIGYFTGAATKTAIGHYEGNAPSLGQAFKPDIVNLMVDFVSGFLMPGTYNSFTRPRGGRSAPKIKPSTGQEGNLLFQKAIPALYARYNKKRAESFGNAPHLIGEPAKFDIDPATGLPLLDAQFRDQIRVDFPEMLAVVRNKKMQNAHPDILRFADWLKTNMEGPGGFNEAAKLIPGLEQVHGHVGKYSLEIGSRGLDRSTGKPFILDRPHAGTYNKYGIPEINITDAATDSRFSGSSLMNLGQTLTHENFHALHHLLGNKDLSSFRDSSQGASLMRFLQEMQATYPGLINSSYIRKGFGETVGGKVRTTDHYKNHPNMAAGELITVMGQYSDLFKKGGALEQHNSTYKQHLQNLIKHLTGANLGETRNKIPDKGIPRRVRLPVQNNFGTARPNSKGIELGFFNRGGMIYASEGQLIDFKPKGTDTVPAMLTPGEFVVNRQATQKHLPILHAINNGAQYFDEGGEVEDPFGYNAGNQTHEQMMEARRKAAKEKKKQLKRQAAVKKLGIGVTGMRAVYEMINAPNTFDLFNENAIIQEAGYHDELVNAISQKTDNLVGDDKKREYLLSKGAELTHRFQYLARIANNSRNLQKNAGRRLEQPLPPEVDVNGVTRGFTLAKILTRQVDSAIAEGNIIKKVSETLKQKYSRFAAQAGGTASPTGGPPPVYASGGMMIPRGTDTVPAMLTPGEFVVNRQAAQANMPLLRSINNGVQYLQDGGSVGGQMAIGGFSNVLATVTRSLGQFTSIIQQATQAAQGTAGGEAGGVNTNGIAQFTQNFDNFIKQLQAITFPEVINVQGTVTANVNVAGGEAFTNLATESINSIVNRQLNQAFNQLEQQSEGQIQNPMQN